MKHKVNIEGIKLYAYHGCLDEEARIGSNYIIDVKFETDFTQAGATRFGSGWAWLCVKADGKLCVCSSPNQDNPLMDISECKGTPILGMDVWEHAYYLNYQNRRPDYMTAFFNVIDWNKVNENYLKAKK